MCFWALLWYLRIFINPRSAVVRRDEYLETRVEKGASIGANATIVCGNIIGAYCSYWSWKCCTKPVTAYALVVGNPCKTNRMGERIWTSIAF